MSRQGGEKGWIVESEGAREGGREDQSCKGGGDSAEKTSLQRQPTLPAPIKEGRSCLLHADCSQRCAAELGKLQATSSVCSPSSAGTGSVNPGDCHPSPRAQCPPHKTTDMSCPTVLELRRLLRLSRGQNRGVGRTGDNQFPCIFRLLELHPSVPLFV